MKKMKKMKYKIVTIMLSLITLATTALPVSAVYAADDITAILVQEGTSSQYAEQKEIPEIKGYYTGSLTLLESQKHICFYCWEKDGEYMCLEPIYDNSIDWRNDFEWRLIYSDRSSVGSTLMINRFAGSLKYYIFDTEEAANNYIKTGDASGAINASDVIEDGYDKDIPVPDIFEIKYLDASTVDAAFSYTNDSELSSFGHELKYEIVPDYVYATSSFTKAIVGGTALGATGNAAKLCNYIRSTVSGGIMQLPITVEAYIADPKNNKDKLYTQSDKTPVTGSVTGSNLCSLSPPDYSSQYVANPAFGAFWGGATNMNKAVFVGTQLSLRVYYTDSSGAKVYSNKVVVRYFSNDIINQLIGKKKAVVAKDDKGEDIVIDEGDTDPTTPVTPGDLTDINLVTYVKEIVGSITSYVALMQSVLAQCPASIWGLITAALAVSLAIIVVKILRGM